MCQIKSFSKKQWKWWAGWNNLRSCEEHGERKIFLNIFLDRLKQGSQTQSDLRAAWDSKKGLAGRIEKSEKNYLQIFI